MRQTRHSDTQHPENKFQVRLVTVYTVRSIRSLWRTECTAFAALVTSYLVIRRTSCTYGLRQLLTKRIGEATRRDILSVCTAVRPYSRTTLVLQHRATVVSYGPVTQSPDTHNMPIARSARAGVQSFTNRQVNASFALRGARA